jgi:hypothetical protein
VLFGIPDSGLNTSEPLNWQARLLAQVAGFSRFMPDIQRWLRDIVEDERIPVLEVRRIIDCFISIGAD